MISSSKMRTVANIGMASAMSAINFFDGSGLMHKRRLTNTPKDIKKAKAKIKKTMAKKSKQNNRKTK